MADSTDTQTDAPTDAEDGVVIGMDEDPAGGEKRASGEGLQRAIFNVPIEVVVSVGVARPLIGDLLEMDRNHLMPIDSNIDDPVELRVKGRVIARGELTQVPDADDQLGVKITEIVSMAGLAE